MLAFRHPLQLTKSRFYIASLNFIGKKRVIHSDNPFISYSSAVAVFEFECSEPLEADVDGFVEASGPYC